jgi:hypothetical protein
MEKIKILDCDFHRNGIGGNGFYVFIFKEGKNRMMGVWFPEGENEVGYNCAVFDMDLLNQNVIEFGKNSWRGDFYVDTFSAYVKEKFPA